MAEEPTRGIREKLKTLSGYAPEDMSFVDMVIAEAPTLSDEALHSLIGRASVIYSERQKGKAPPREPSIQ